MSRINQTHCDSPTRSVLYGIMLSSARANQVYLHPMSESNLTENSADTIETVSATATATATVTTADISEEVMFSRESIMLIE